MIIVTGGAGFIGCNLVKALNKIGERDILVVDNLSSPQKKNNLKNLEYSRYLDKHEFYDLMSSGSPEKDNSFSSVSTVFHQGACSDTMETDEEYILHNNFIYSKKLFHFCERYNAQFIYASSASVYGSGKIFSEKPENESALNAYARSKLQFDNYMRSQSGTKIQSVGLRYFNVYGGGENHKQHMASVAWHFYNQFRDTEKIHLFCGSDGYGDGEQVRDFIYIDDVIDVNLFFMKNPDISGIFNVGTGCCQSFNDVAVAVINCSRQNQIDQQISLRGAISNGQLIYIPMPEALIGKYQSYTQADLTKLESVGYQASFHDVNQGVSKYISQLSAS